MRICLFHPEHGYYSTKKVFGGDGDFVTSPQISQLFGEMVAVNILHRASKYYKFRYIELGPGDGVLMGDVLKTFKQLKKSAYLDSIHLVERSDRLRKLQQEVIEDALQQKINNNKVNGVQIYWHQDFEDVPVGAPPFIVAHEFFDALPVHQFKKTQDGYREVLIDVDDDGKFNFGLASVDTPANALLPKSDDDVVEFSPESLKISKQVSLFLQKHGSGMAMFIDYGGNSRGATFRSIYQHKFVDPLAYPGESDLTADVDFEAIKNVMSGQGLLFNMETQKEFLERSGIGTRLKQILQKSHNQKHVVEAVRRLTSDDEMGRIYKVLSVYSS